MAEKRYVLKHPSGKHVPVVVTSAARREVLLLRGYTETRGDPEPKAEPGQQRRSRPTTKGSSRSKG